MFCSLRRDEESRMGGRTLWFSAACVWACSLAASIAGAQEMHHRFPLTSAQIVNAMRDRQLPTRDVQVRLAAPMTAIASNPHLEIQAITLLSSREIRLRVACQDHAQCLSFFAIATYPEVVDTSELKREAGNRPAGVAQPVRAVRPAAEAPAASASAKRSGSVQPPILRSGSPASLDFDEDRIHVRIKVICLESGAVGDRIRVTTRDRKQVYVAEIVTPVLLKGTF